VLEHQSAFMDALRNGRQMRKRVFDTIEQHHAEDFGNSKVGPRLYADILAAVRESGAAEALTEFESRFLPLVNSDPARDTAAIRISQQAAAEAAAADRKRGAWVGLSVVLLVAMVGAAVVGFRTVKITPAQAGRSAHKPMATQIMPAPPQAVIKEAPVAETKAPEPAFETVTEESPDLSAKEEPVARD
jgi:hypothetical protein